MFSYSNKQDRKKQTTKLSVPFSPLMYCLNTKLTIDSFLFYESLNVHDISIFAWFISICFSDSNSSKTYAYKLTSMQILVALVWTDFNLFKKNTIGSLQSPIVDQI